MPISTRRVIALAASLVCSVDSTRWPVSADSIAIWAVSRSRISPTMMMSGSARIIERRPVEKCRPAFELTCTCVMPSSWYSTGILDRDDVLLDRVELAERGVQRRRLARARRPGDEHGAVGLVEGALEAVLLGRRHAELLQRHDDGVLVEDAHDDRLAVHAGQRHDAQVDVVAVDRQADATVLRHAPLGDVEVAHDLHAADDAEHHPPLHHRGLDEHAVDAEAHAQLASRWARGGCPRRPARRPGR